jgi:2-keto-4-pentenoate hydratase/2-oxohepta-3-ene-1,7-dioic acid hydratase in catechol pathway
MRSAYVAGTMAFNDVSAGELQMKTSQWSMGKAIDTFAPCVPTLVFMDGIDDVQAARVERRVNGETVQSGTTASMFFTMAEIIIFISSVMTFEPRDIGATRRRDFMRTPPCWSRRMTSSKSRSRRRPARKPVVERAILRR